MSVSVCMQRDLREVQKQWRHSEAQASEALRHNRQAPYIPFSPQLSDTCLKFLLWLISDPLLLQCSQAIHGQYFWALCRVCASGN